MTKSANHGEPSFGPAPIGDDYDEDYDDEDVTSPDYRITRLDPKDKKKKRHTGILAGYLSEDELARELGVTRATIRNWKALGEAPAVTRIGKRVYYASTDVREWLQSCRVEV